MNRPPRGRGVFAALSLLAAACGGGTAGATAPDTTEPEPSTAESGTPDAAVSGTAEGLARPTRAVVTTTILGDVVRDVAAADATVEVLMGAGQDPHAFSPSAQQAASLRAADLVVANGLSLEESMLDLLEAAEDDGVEVLWVAEELDPVRFEDDHHGHEGHADGGHGVDEHAEDEHAEDEHGHDHGELDPHVWFDPVRMADGTRLIAQRLAAVDEVLEDAAWTARGDAVADDILATHDRVAQALASVPVPCRRLVTNHDAFRYLAARYGFEVVGTVIPGTSTQADPSAEAFAALAQTLRSNEVPAIFGETTQSTRLAESLAEEVGRDIEVVELFTGSLGEPGSGADTYVGMLTTNAERIEAALRAC